MIPVSVLLDDIDFDALVELARSRLPAEASVWTDYNFHDPGMTLVDLVAYIADTQIYSLARHRRDERIAIARLLGIEPRGAVPAKGTLYPSFDITGVHRVEAGMRLSPVRASAPSLTVVQTVDLLPVTVESIVTESPSGNIDHTATNERAQASFAPFGVPTDLAAALRIILRGKLDPPDFRLSLGFTLDVDSAFDEALGGVSVFFRKADGGEILLSPECDTTDKLQRSGVMVLKLVDGWNTAKPTHQIVLRPTGAGALLPRLVQIAANALPVAQYVAVEDRKHSFGTSRPGQTLTLTIADLLDGPNREDGTMWRLTEQAPVVNIDGVEWDSGDLDTANPDDEFYAITEVGDSISIRFGNGINGSTVRLGSSLGFSAMISRGAAGNIVSELNWMLDDHRLKFTNAGPVRGGADPLSPKDMLDAARTRLSENRPLATSLDIAEAARKLPVAYAVDRAEILEGWERGRKSPASSRTRTLVVARKAFGEQRTESAAWLRAVRRRLAPRLDLGERLLVIAPNYREIAIRARVVTTTGQRPETVKAAIENDLNSRLTPSGKVGATWPLGRDVSLIAIGGWIRQVPGVLHVEELVVTEGGKMVIESALVLKRDELPNLIGTEITARTAGASA